MSASFCPSYLRIYRTIYREATPWSAAVFAAVVITASYLPAPANAWSTSPEPTASNLRMLAHSLAARQLGIKKSRENPW